MDVGHQREQARKIWARWRRGASTGSATSSPTPRYTLSSRTASQRMVVGGTGHGAVRKTMSTNIAAYAAMLTTNLTSRAMIECQG